MTIYSTLLQTQVYSVKITHMPKSHICDRLLGMFFKKNFLKIYLGLFLFPVSFLKKGDAKGRREHKANSFSCLSLSLSLSSTHVHSHLNVWFMCRGAGFLNKKAVNAANIILIPDINIHFCQEQFHQSLFLALCVLLISHFSTIWQLLLHKNTLCPPLLSLRLIHTLSLFPLTFYGPLSYNLAQVISV